MVSIYFFFHHGDMIVRSPLCVRFFSVCVCGHWCVRVICCFEMGVSKLFSHVCCEGYFYMCVAKVSLLCACCVLVLCGAYGWTMTFTISTSLEKRLCYKRTFTHYTKAIRLKFNWSIICIDLYLSISVNLNTILYTKKNQPGQYPPPTMMYQPMQMAVPMQQQQQQQQVN